MASKYKKACEALVETINATGGVVIYKNGMIHPKGDYEWADLGDVYSLACDALGVEMVVEHSNYASLDQALA